MFSRPSKTYITCIAAICASASFTVLMLFAGIAAACEGGGGSECGFEKPSVTTEAATSIGIGGAVLHGKVNPHGCETSYVFEWGTTEKYGSSAGGSAGSGTSTVAKEQFAAGTTGTTYHFRISATNINGTSHGEDKTFSVLYVKPSVTTESVTSVTETGATLHGIVNPRGNTSIYYFEYGVDTKYGKKSGETVTTSVDSDENVEHGVTGLTPKTEYHFRLVATNNEGTAKGGDKTFTTK
jgi:trimeric autotransporter adhesin